jgi:hypothetical protein
MNTILAKAMKSVKEEEKLSQGRYPLNTVVRITGDVVVGKGGDKKATNCLLSKEFFMMVLKASGITREAAMAFVESTATSYLKEWTGSEEEKKAAKKDREEALSEYDPDGKGIELFDRCAAALPRVPKAGPTTFEGEIEEIALSASQETNNVIEIGKVG